MNDYEICWEQKHIDEDLDCRMCPHRYECAGADWIEEEEE